jgi:proteic killer suppression protein
MIRSFRSRPLQRYWTKDDTKRLPPDWLARIAMILDALESAKAPADMNLPGLNLHPLKGAEQGRYAVKVSANYRITFGWQGEDATDVDLEDYH